ncbi:hypothetical protein BACCAP_03316 [Pseudoflavonifractor capillosus ATCC 29799]|uniref:Uncharacterized protein n=1 Tax=Pseudoflavonifractor capillosus ATCC 29799 TaxID=411467 RepID=A6NYL5_9FIRM|nr:hypothetical protein BACCAP_03316 [Pseudoflavonifractor capillosus ATCC 29799]
MPRLREGHDKAGNTGGTRRLFESLERKSLERRFE